MRNIFNKIIGMQIFGTSFYHMPVLLNCILTPLFFPSSSVSLSYLILAVPKRECLGKHSRTSFTFLIAIMNETLFFRSARAIKIRNRAKLKNSTKLT